MKLKTTTNTRKVAIIVAAITLLVGAGIATALYTTKTWPFNNSSADTQIDFSPPSTDESRAGEETREQTPNNGDSEPSPLNPGAEQPHDPDRMPTAASNPRLTITVASQSDSTLTIRTLIQQASPGGECTLSLERSNTQVFSQKVGTQMVASNYTCMGYDLDTSAFSDGEYNIKITYANNSRSTTANQLITLR